jgi:cation-transporting P-type ATPase F
MAIQALVAGISGRTEKLTDAPAIVIGIIGTIVLQIIFSQWNVMNNLFSTAPLNSNQWLICLLIGLPIIPVAVLVNRFDPLD